MYRTNQWGNTMFKRLFVDNYKCFVNFTLDLQEMTLLAGYNGAGKTSVLDIMHSLRELLAGRAKVSDPGMFPASSKTAWQKTDVQTIELHADVLGDELRYRLQVEHSPQRNLVRISHESLTDIGGNPLFQFEGGEVRLFRDDHSAGPVYSADWSDSAMARVPERNDNKRLSRFLKTIRNMIVCSLNPASFEYETGQPEITLDRDIGNFSSWFQHVQLEDPGKVEAFKTAIMNVIDGLDQIRLQQTGLNKRALMIRFGNGENRYELALDALSDGQRALIALYALTCMSSGLGHTLLLDEPENYVALAEIQPWLMELDERCGESIPQAVICTHHPEIIDFLGTDYGLCLLREQSGATRIKNLSEIARSYTTNDSRTNLRLSELLARGWEA